MRQLFLTLALTLWTTIAVAQNVTGVSSKRESSYKTIITYTLAQQSSISLHVSIDGGKTYSEALRYVTGDVGNIVLPGNKTITWDHSAEGYATLPPVVYFKVSNSPYPQNAYGATPTRTRSTMYAKVWDDDMVEIKATHVSDKYNSRIRKTINCPEQVLNDSQLFYKELKTEVEVIVNSEGQISSAKVTGKSKNKEFDQIALEEVQSMTGWTPAYKNGVPVASKFKIAVKCVPAEAKANAIAEAERKQREAAKKKEAEELAINGYMPSNGNLQSNYTQAQDNISKIDVPANNGQHYDGIDISRHQKQINWDLLATEKNVKFIYIKATEGTTYKDPKYDENLREARRLNFPVGLYHFLRPYESVDDQFQLFVSVVKKEDLDLIPMLDVELKGNCTNKQLQDSLMKFCDLLEKHYGCKSIIYTNAHFYHNVLNAVVKDYPLWMARYDTNEPKLSGGTKWILWQFSDKGHLAGIETTVNLSCFNKGYNVKDLLIKNNPSKKYNVSTIKENKDVDKSAREAAQKKGQEEAYKKAEAEKKAAERKAKEERRAAEKKAKEEAKKKGEQNK